MRTVILTRGPNEVRLPVIARLKELLNVDSNHITAHFLHFSDYEYLRDTKAEYATLKKNFKLALAGEKHIVVDAESSGIQSWSGFSHAMEGTSLYTIGLDCTAAPLNFKGAAGFMMYQNVRDHMVDEILQKNHLT
jgi:hypothetical protein